MALTVETGAGISGADSYVSRADYIAYAATVGVTIADAAAADVELIKAAQFIDRHESNLQGYRTTRDQAMSFPRVGVIVDSWYWNSNEIPRQVILAQYAFALDVNAGIDLYNRPVNPNLIASEKRVEGAVSVKYAITGGDQKSSRTSTGDSLLASLLKRNGLYSVNLERA